MLNFHATFNAAQRKKGAICPVEQNREVVFLVDGCTLRDHYAVYRVALDGELENVLGVLTSFGWGFGNLHTAGFAAASGFYLCLNNYDSTNFGGRSFGFFRGVGD